MRVGKLQWKESLIPSENPLVILQVVNEDAGRHWERLWNVKVALFWLLCCRSFHTMKGLIVLVVANIPWPPRPQPSLGLLSWSHGTVFLVEK